MADYPEEDAFRAADLPPVDVAAELRRARAEVLVLYLPVGAEQAARHYADAALSAGGALVNCIPVFIASDPASAKRFTDAGLPIVGDDIKSQVGATIVHRTLARLLADRGVPLRRTYLALLEPDVRFDLVLFLGVFYHLRYGVLALETVARLRPKLLVFQSLSMPGPDRADTPPPKDFDFDTLERVNEPSWPKMAFVENRFAGDETNWWLPDRAAATGLLRSAGFRIVASANQETHVCEPTGAPPPADEEWLAATGADPSGQ